MYSINLHQMKSYLKFIDNAIKFYKNHKSITQTKIDNIKKIYSLHADVIDATNLALVSNCILLNNNSIDKIDSIIREATLVKNNISEYINNYKKKKSLVTINYAQTIETINKLINDFLIFESSNC